MYRGINEIKNLYGYVFLDDKVYTHRKKVGKMQELSLFGDVLWESNEKDIWNYHVHRDFILFNLYDNDEVFDNTYVYNRLTKELIYNKKQQLYCILNKECYKDNILYDVKNDEVLLFNLSEGKIIKEVVAKTSGRVSFISDNYIVKNDNINIYIYNKTDFSLLWQQNFAKVAEYQEIDGEHVLGKIREVYCYKESIVVLTQLFIFRVEIQTGKIICQQKLPAGFMVLSIHKNKAYGCYGYHCIEIDLDTLEVINFHRIEYEDYEGDRHLALMNHPVYHQGLIFHAVRLEGGFHCVGAINPETGKRVWIQSIGAYDINSIDFYENKMFVHDTGGTLHILEKE